MSISPRNSAPKSIFLLLPAIALLLVGTVSLRAQAVPESTKSNVAARLTQPIQESAVVTLRGNTHPLAQARYDRGPAPASTPAKRMLMVLKRSDQQEADLKAYLAAVQTVGSPSYHKFLTPDQFGALYGPAEADIQTVSTWLQGHGLAVSKVNKAKTVLEFSGNFAQLQETFHTSIHTYLIDGEQHYANTSDPQIPAALAPVVSGLARMNDFKFKSSAVPGPRGVYNPVTRTFQPEFTKGSGTNSVLYVGPADAATIYNSPISGLNSNFAGGTVYDGTGVNIGVIGDSNIDVTGVALYRSFFGLSSNTPNVIVDGDDPGVGDIYNSDTGEALLDVEIASGIAPGAKVNLYISAGSVLQQGIDYAGLRAIDDNLVSVLNLSFGGCEAFLGTAGNTFYYNEWEEAAAQGISVTVSTGDSGAATCDNGVSTASHGLQISGLSSTPFNIAVGGTDFDILLNNFTGYVAPTNPSPYLGTATKYIPENPWNNSTNTNTTFSSNVAFKDSQGNTNIVGAGGGASSCVQSTSSGGTILCAGGYPKPSWQEIFDNGDKVRDVPDVSLFASNGFYNAVWAICATGLEGGTAVNDCQVSNGAVSHITGFGGTSTASPAFAGVLAIINQKTGGRLGQANQVLYPLAKQFPATFHDVTVGNISVPCTSGSPDCGTNGFLTGYDAGSGYDLATGLGSVDISALANNWGSLTFAASTTALSLNGATAPISITHGRPVTAAVKVTSGAGTPTGDVAILDSLSAGTSPNNVAVTHQQASGPLLLATDGTATQSINSLPGGTYNVVAHYAGDGTIAASDSNAIPVVVTPENSTLRLATTAYDATTLSSVSTASIPYGTYLVFDATPVGTASATDGLATGSVTFTLPGGNFTSTVNSEGFAEGVVNQLAPGTQTISVSYTGDGSFNGSTTTGSLIIVQGTTSTTMAVTSSTTASLTPTDDGISPFHHGSGWYTAGGAALAFVALFGIPARRRAWRAMFGLMLFASLASFANGCGGGGSNAGGGGGGGTTTTYNVSATVATDSAGTPPTGTVTFKSGTTSLSTATVSGSTTNGVDQAKATGTFTSTSLVKGVNTVTATYSGDTNYAGSVSAGVAITVAAVPANAVR